MGIFDFIKDAGSKVIKGGKDDKFTEARQAADEAKAKDDKLAKAREAASEAKAKVEASGPAQKARSAASAAGAATAKARDAAVEKATAAKDALAAKQTAAREAFLERRAEAKKADELEEYLDKLDMRGDIDVRFDDGVVYLSGSVPDQETLERVVLAVGNVEGVEKVDEHLEVAEPAEAARMHTVVSGDTLSAIAKQYYGDANRYPEIFEANKPMLTDPNMIYPGQVLRIP